MSIASPSTPLAEVSDALKQIFSSEGTDAHTISSQSTQKSVPEQEISTWSDEIRK